MHNSLQVEKICKTKKNLNTDTTKVLFPTSYDKLKKIKLSTTIEYLLICNEI